MALHILNRLRGAASGIGEPIIYTGICYHCKSSKSRFVDLFMFKHSTKSANIQALLGGLHLTCKRAFVPTNAQNRLPAWPPKICFCLLGQRPKPFEQPRGRGWLRIRFTNAILPCKVKTGKNCARQKTGKRRDRICPAKKRQSGHRPAMKLCTSAGQPRPNARLPQAVPPPACGW